MELVVYAEWRSATELTQDVEGAFAGAFRPADASVCVWISPDDPHVLMVAFEVDADGYEGALDAARAELAEAGARTPAVGSLERVTAMTDEGYRAWSA
ncbi:hypothetical protein [Microlunatus flavus]|uniref:Quinol monooxygenase YgiN n=1 Tax=Microlunatus flavus TaxID=1036181 RepID=A0A1H9J5D0_9ACTN|nr:hypothetical protein [Microlunatus flavus]SEQ81825.1 hypothetical protein SAMN05421756_10691 [Microlunatus flavus]